MKSKKQIASVLVFGDIGRSPRMKNHSMQLAQAGYHVYLVGYVENKVHRSLSENSSIEIVDISSNLVERLKKLPRFLYLFYAVLRVLIQMFQLFATFLYRIQKPEFILIQNPPSIPVLSTIAIICWFRGISMIVDFHNYGYTILALGVKQKLLIALAKFYEKFFGRRCDLAFCVSDAMKHDLSLNWGIQALTLYDKANTHLFGPIPLQEQHELLSELTSKSFSTSTPNAAASTTTSTLFTQIVNGKVEKKPNRPLLLVSSTSWTKDEDFSILLDAMERYEEAATGKSDYPDLYLMITGKGPEKERYEAIIKFKQPTWKRIRIETVWLKAEDYPRLLACADVGVCLHYSSSGLDLPMKVVDMLGSNIPVFAIQYQCIHELVEQGKNGFIFKDTDGLTQLFLKYFKSSKENEQIFEGLRKNAAKFRESTWESEWKSKALPVIKALPELKNLKNNKKSK